MIGLARPKVCIGEEETPGTRYRKNEDVSQTKVIKYTEAITAWRRPF